MNRAVTVELMKVRRSMVVRTTTLLVVVLVPLLCLGFVAIAAGESTAAVALKAQAMVVGEGWDAYLGVLAQILAAATFIGPGVVAAWTFGREHADRTFSALFAMPVSRGEMAAAKFVVLLGWGLLLTMLLLLAAMALGLAAGVGSLAGVDLVPRLARLLVAGSLTSMISLTLGFVASVGRGYLPAVGALVLLVFFSQIAVLFGTGGWFPYAAPGLYAMGGAGGAPEVSAVQLLLVPATTIALAWLTVWWWLRAEVT